LVPALGAPITGVGGEFDTEMTALSVALSEPVSVTLRRAVMLACDG
jgi:hypothetical protein